MSPQPEKKQNELSGIKRVLAGHPAIYGLFVTLIVAVFVFFVAIVPAVRRLQPGGSSSLVDLDAKIASAQKTFDAENNLVDAVSRLGAGDRERIEYALPSAADSPGALAQIASIVGSAGGVIASADFASATAQSEEKLPNGVSAIDISLNVARLDYETFKIFLDAISGNLRLLDVKNFVFSTGGSVAVNLRTYYRK